MKKSTILLGIIILVSNLFLVQALCPNGEIICDNEIDDEPNNYVKYNIEERCLNEKQIKKIIKDNCNGCLEDKYCYPFGYIKDKKYCSFDPKHNRYSFTNQSASKEICTYSFECKSNLCFDGKCAFGTMESLLFSFQEKIDALSIKLDEEKNKAITLRKELNENKEYSEKTESNTSTEERKKQNKIIELFRIIFYK